VTVRELIRLAEADGIEFRVRGGNVVLEIPEPIIDIWVPKLKPHKAAIAALLAEESKAGQLPWPGYNGGQQFACDRCGTRFDTSAGFARHQVGNCKDDMEAIDSEERTA
jgi:hypothetical protein